MGQNPLQMEKKSMSNAATDATEWANYLVRREYHGPGDTLEAAMLRASRKHKVPFNLFWTLRYRQPKRLWADAYLAIKTAFENECLRQEAKLRDEYETARKVMGDAANTDPFMLALKTALEAMEKEREG
jgi:hypothetical protein